MNELETITPRQLREILFQLPDGMTVREIREALFEIDNQDKEYIIGFSMWPKMMNSNAELEAAN